MKIFLLPPLVCLCAVALVISSCTLDKEPEIPTGVNNIEPPVFLIVEITPGTNNNLQAKARLSSLGNLNILQHGWVWNDATEPTLQDNKRVLGSLTSDSFLTEIAGLESGKVYYLRPFVSNGMGTSYGPEQCSFLDVNFTITTDTEIFKGADVQFVNTTPGNFNYLWDFGDGDTSTQDSPKHTFDKGTGSVTVRLTADISGCKVTRAMVLNIIADPFQNYWVPISGGTFTMGCTNEQAPDCNANGDEEPHHQVTLNPFYLGKTEITQRQWLAVMGESPSYFYQCGLECPVEFVSWQRIIDEFIPALYLKTGRMYRLPTEAEWEFAARGGNKSMGYKYAGGNNLDSVAWNGSNSAFRPSPVGLKLPNELGLYDMSGNVFEWCQDWYGIYPDTPSTNPTGPAMGDSRAHRGGSWYGDVQDCRVAFRHHSLPGDRLSNLGFRLARSN